MKLNFKRVKTGSPEARMSKALYSRAFPDDERAPFLMLLLKSRRKSVDFWSVSCEGQWAGFIYVVNSADLSYVFYLAVTEEQRGKGIGSGILKSVQQLYKGRRLFLAIEQIDEDSENYQERVNRKNFYLRCGFKELHRKLREGVVTYDILGIGGDVTAKEYKKLMTDYAGKVLSRVFTMEFVDTE